MENVSRPLIALLVGTVAFFALWLTALKPSSSSTSGPSKPALGAYQSAIDKAHQAVGIANAASIAHGGAVASSPHPSTLTTSPPATASAKTPAPRPVVVRVHASSGTLQRVNVVQRALGAHKVIALLFYNPAAADDQAVKTELASVPTHNGRVVKLAAPLSELARYAIVANQVPVNSSPTLVLIDPARQAGTIVGFADRFEIAQRVDDALAVKPVQ